MSYAKATAGRARHMRNLHIDLDPSSITYQESPPCLPDDLDQLVALCTWRLPRSRQATALMLWNMWEIPEPSHVALAKEYEQVRQRFKEMGRDRVM